MAFSLLTTQQAYDRFLANIEAQINQTTPITPKAFNRVISQVEAMQYTELGKYAAERVKQNLALTATGDDLKKLADEYGVTLRPEVACQLTITLPAVTSTVIPITVDFVGDSNAARFIPDEQATAVFGIAAILVTAQVAGAASNLVVGDTLTLGSPVSGAENTATVNIVRTIGLDEEDEESLRRRVLNEIRTVGGGGNATDYRTWAEGVTNVNRAFPYAGAPLIGIVGFLDGNCNSSVTTDWTAGNSATLTKSTADPYEGTRALRIAYNAVSEPFAYQSPLTVGKQYHVTGWARGDGTAIPSVRNLSQFTQWTGTSSTSWQAFDFEFVAAGTDINFYSSAVATGWVEFDNITIVQSNLPGDRTVYIEAVSEVDPDGIPTQSILDDVRAAINYNQDTLKGRPPLGETDSTLAVEPIRRTSFYTEIRNLDVPADQVVSVKSRIETAVDTYFRGITPFIDGIDAGFDRNDLVTSMSLAKVIQEITSTVGGSAASVGFGTELGVFLGSYQLTQGELSKLGAISYA